MSRKRRTSNPRLLRKRRAYSSSEIAEILDLHVRTIQRWHKEGMKILAGSAKPYLVMGGEAQQFIRERSRKQKKPLKLGEFFCPRCQIQRKSLPERLIAQHAGRKLGKRFKQVILKGLCESCGSRLTLFSSDRKLEEMKKMGLTLAEHLTVLKGNDSCSGNVDILGGSNNES